MEKYLKNDTFRKLYDELAKKQAHKEKAQQDQKERRTKEKERHPHPTKTKEESKKEATSFEKERLIQDHQKAVILLREMAKKNPEMHMPPQIRRML